MFDTPPKKNIYFPNFFFFWPYNKFPLTFVIVSFGEFSLPLLCLTFLSPSLYGATNLFVIASMHYLELHCSTTFKVRILLQMYST